LQDVYATLSELETDAAKYRDGSWLRVTVRLTEKDPDINRKVRQILPNALVVRVETPASSADTVVRPPAGAPPAQHYTAFHRKEHEREPESTVLEAFDQLYEQTSGDA
jgi:hypothetical protein